MKTNNKRNRTISNSVEKSYGYCNRFSDCYNLFLKSYRSWIAKSGPWLLTEKKFAWIHFCQVFFIKIQNLYFNVAYQLLALRWFLIFADAIVCSTAKVKFQGAMLSFTWTLSFSIYTTLLILYGSSWYFLFGPEAATGGVL